MTSLERGARALAFAETGIDEWDQLDDDFQEMLKETVRAVLVALREPDSRMKHVGAQVVMDVGSREATTELEGRAAMVWRHMISAAVAET
jgi:hypothetical protein